MKTIQNVHLLIVSANEWIVALGIAQQSLNFIFFHTVTNLVEDCNDYLF